ncbi:MAG: hypothetical protein ACRD90_06865 [Nitrosopumilaceae archaeon]
MVIFDNKNFDQRRESKLEIKETEDVREFEEEFKEFKETTVSLIKAAHKLKLIDKEDVKYLFLQNLF